MLIRAVNTAISAGWLILAVVAVRAVCRKVPRAMICLLWALVAVRLVCPFSLKSPLSLIPNAQTIPASAVSAAAPKAPEASEPAGTDAVDDPAYAAPAVHIKAADIRDWRVYGTVLWLAGTAALLACALVSWLRLRRQVSASVRVKGNIFICDWIGSPFILGILRPRIYLPSAMDREQFTYVLAHEHAHLKRRDHWWKPLGFLLLAVYWFHPLVWTAYILFCRDMELACDERVVRDMGIWERKLYSEILLCCSSPGPAASVCPVGFGGVGVKARIKSVLRCRRPAPRTILGMGAVCAVLAVCFLTDPPRSLASDAHVTAEPSPTPIVHHLTGEDIAALNSPRPQPPGEEEFAAMLAEEWISDGYTALTYEEFASRYTESLVPLDRAPERYKNIGYVFVRPDPGIPEYTMITQVSYDYEGQRSIFVQQTDTDAGDTEPFYYYTDCDETGAPHRDNSWFSWRAGYDGSVGGVSVNMQLRSVEDLGARSCWLTLRALWPDW